MKSILTSQLTVTNARGHWSGNKNGSLITPKIVIKGITPDGEPFGAVEASISGSTTDGGAMIKLWDFVVPFGAIGINRGACLKHTASGKEIQWFDLWKIKPEDAGDYQISANYPKQGEFVVEGEQFPIAVENFAKLGFTPLYCDVEALHPIWSLQSLDKNWEEILQWIYQNEIDHISFDENEILVGYSDSLTKFVAPSLV